MFGPGRIETIDILKLCIWKRSGHSAVLQSCTNLDYSLRWKFSLSRLSCNATEKDSYASTDIPLGSGAPSPAQKLVDISVTVSSDQEGGMSSHESHWLCACLFYATIFMLCWLRYMTDLSWKSFRETIFAKSVQNEQFAVSITNFAAQ